MTILIAIFRDHNRALKKAVFQRKRLFKYSKTDIEYGSSDKYSNIWMFVTALSKVLYLRMQLRTALVYGCLWKLVSLECWRLGTSYASCPPPRTRTVRSGPPTLLPTDFLGALPRISTQTPEPEQFSIGGPDPARCPFLTNQSVAEVKTKTN